MKRSPFSRRSKLTQEADTLLRLAKGLADSGSRMEDSFWETQLLATCERLLHAGKEEAFGSALDKLANNDSRGYEALAGMIEAASESARLHGETGDFDVQLFAAPLLAWSRFSIFSGELPQEALGNLRVHLQAHVLSANAQLALADVLFSPDQMPYGYVATYQLAQQLWAAALNGRNVHVDSRQLPQTAPFISDIRYVVGAIAVPAGQALFRWQEEDGRRDEASKQWVTQGGACLQALLPGCAVEPLLPGAYFTTCRQADLAARPFSLRAAVDFLHATLNATPTTLRAAVAAFGEQRLEEYRIGFSLPDSNEVCHGVVWPLLGAENEETDSAGEIEATLKHAGVTDITLLQHTYPPEYCDDCGAALFPNAEGEILHVEMPEQEVSTPQHLH